MFINLVMFARSLSCADQLAFTMSPSRCQVEDFLTARSVFRRLPTVVLRHIFLIKYWYVKDISKYKPTLIIRLGALKRWQPSRVALLFVDKVHRHTT